MTQLVPTINTPEDWAPLESLVAVDEFERVGTRREVQDWREYTGLLTHWSAPSIDLKPPCSGFPSCPASCTSRPKSGTTVAKDSLS